MEHPPNTRLIRYEGRPIHGRRDSLDTRQPAGFWFPGTVVAFTPQLCNEYGRQCHQVNGTPCDAGAACTCWTDQFLGDWNSHDSAHPWFSDVTPKEDPDTPTPDADASPATAAKAAKKGTA